MVTSLLFSGHMVDRPDRGTPRFPQALSEAARGMIGARLDAVTGRPDVVGFASCARGGDILFHEECRRRGIATVVVLPFSPDQFVETSVEGVPGTDWQARFWRIWNATPEERREIMDLPVSSVAYGACDSRLLDRARAGGSVHMIALWNGRSGDRPSGTAELLKKARQLGDKADVLYFPTCFVVMGFGEKSDLATGRKLNLDKTYKNVIKPAVEQAGCLCVRADEIRHSGVIDIPMYDMLFDAAFVIADLSTSNLNAIFELGVRHALKPRATIVIAEKQFASPFDVNHIAIRKYEHLGTDIGYDETVRMQQELRRLIETLKETNSPDSPVYSLLRDLNPPHREERKQAPRPEPALQTVAREDSYAAQWESAMEAIDKAKDANDAGEFAKARQILQSIYDSQAMSADHEQPRTPRPRVIQELAFATYKEGEHATMRGESKVAEAAYASAIDLLRQLDPERTTDPETLGLWSAVHKRRSELDTLEMEQRRTDLDIAIYSAERGFLIRQDFYTGINLAFLLDFRASLSKGEEQIADRILANRVRRKVVEFARNQIKTLSESLARPDGERDDQVKDELYWAHASLGEALIGLGDRSGEQTLASAQPYARAAWMPETTAAQIRKLRMLRPDLATR